MESVEQTFGSCTIWKMSRKRIRKRGGGRKGGRRKGRHGRRRKRGEVTGEKNNDDEMGEVKQAKKGEQFNEPYI
jgi:hypothetical protein